MSQCMLKGWDKLKCHIWKVAQFKMGQKMGQ